MYSAGSYFSVTGCLTRVPHEDGTPEQTILQIFHYHIRPNNRPCPYKRPLPKFPPIF